MGEPVETPTLAACRQQCELPLDRLRLVAEDLRAEMRAGLAADGCALKMLPTYVTRLPNGTERGSWYALDLGGTNFRVLKLQLGDVAGAVADVQSEEVAIPAALLRGTVGELFDFIATQVVAFTGADATGSLGFTFSFACAQKGLQSGILLTWTKGFALVDGPGLDVVALLQGALARAGSAMHVAVLVNDTVGTLAAAHYGDTAARMAVILGTGTNAAYMEAVDRVPKWADAPPGASQVVINIEWGNLHVPSLPRLAADDTVDAQSPNPGQQAFEKLIAGMYLGRIAQLTLLQVDAETAGGSARLLTDGQRARLHADGAFTTPLLSTVANDESPGGDQARAALASALGEPLSEATLHTVTEVCRLVTRRAARLSAAAIVGVLEHCGAGAGAPGDEPTVAVDGGLFEHHTTFAAQVVETVASMGITATLRLTPDGSGVGAALLAAAVDSP